MDNWLIVAITVMLLFLIGIGMAAARYAAKQWYLFGLLTIAGTVIIYNLQPTVRPEFKVESRALRSLSADDLMKQIQSQLQENPNNARLWFELGQGYLLNNELDAALICFDYAIQLTEQPSATQLAAKASTLYYLHSQMINEEVSLLIDQALQLEPYNEAALSLLANDHFISFRFTQAIEIWTHLLDSKDPKLDREAVIRSIQRAQSLIPESKS